MERVHSFEDDCRDIYTYAFSDGTRLSLEGRAVREYGVGDVLRHCGYWHLLPTERFTVTQRGRVIGTVPPDFEPAAIKSTAFLYEPRGGDFVRDGDGWAASPTITPGDFEAIPGFVWEADHAK